MTRRTNIATIIFMTLFTLSCEWVKKEGDKVIDKSKDKIKQVWSDAVDEVISSEGSFRKTNFEESFGELRDLEIIEIDGVRNDRLISFYEVFLVYEGTAEDVLDFFRGLKSSKPELSDNDFKESDTLQISKRTLEIESNEPNLNERIEFFKGYRDLYKFKVYTINKYPLTHTIIIESNSKKIYHYYENYLD